MTSNPDTPSEDAERIRKLRSCFTRYRIMAFVVGTMLLLVFLFLFLRLAGLHVKGFEKVVDPLHGYLYLIYLVAAADLALRARWGLGRIAVVAAAGFVPFLAFYVEHRIRVQMESEDPATWSGRRPNKRGATP